MRMSSRAINVEGVLMTERFTASNGWYIEDDVLYADSGGVWGQINGDFGCALIEYGRHLERIEHDAKLGRWRSKEHPDYVLYAGPQRDLVLDERSGVSVLVSAGSVQGGGVFEAVAREYFDAQEPPKPWLDAQPGEVWVLTIDGAERAAVIDNGGWASISDESIPLADTEGSRRITAGRRIWPEPEPLISSTEGAR